MAKDKKGKKSKGKSKGERGSVGRAHPAVPEDIAAMPLHARAVALVEATAPLLELFATLDAVFTEDDALTDKKQVSLGRCYEGWKRARKALDPEFDPEERPRRRVGTPRIFGPSQEQLDNLTG